MRDYRELFGIFDLNNDNSICRFEIGQIMNALGEDPGESEITKMVEKIDFNSDGRIDFNEFVCMVVIVLEQTASEEEQLVKVFNRFDRNGDG